MKLLTYTRTPQEEEIYSAKLAYSMHLALLEEEELLALNHNSGILYAKATQNPDGTLHAKSLRKPWLFPKKGGGYGVLAVRTEADGTADEDAAGKVLLFTTEDLLHYEEQPLLDLGRGTVIEQAVCIYSEEKDTYGIGWREETGECFWRESQALEEAAWADTEGIPLERAQWEALCTGWSLPGTATLPDGSRPVNCVEIPEEEARRLKCRFVTPVNISNQVPAQITAGCEEELKAVKAVAGYSDGSQVSKRVDWNRNMVDWSTPGKYRVTGRVHQDHYEFPVAWHKADPCIGKWKDKYYFISTNDRDQEHSIYIREADTIPGLVTAQQIKILDAYTYPHLGNLLWAPELHVIRDRLYVFHAGTPRDFMDEQCLVMALRKQGDPKNPEDWEMPVRVVRKDGSFLYDKAGITLDMTEFEVDGEHYVCWSQRQFHPVDQGAWLYIAKVDPQEPWRLITDPVLLSMPEYGWANNHTFVDEGPFALIRDNRIYLTFSSAAVDSTYVVGLLSAQAGADLLDPGSWVKENYPLLTSRSVEGEYGTGHNSYVTDEDGLVWNVYHARPGVKGPRSAGIRRVHFNAEGFPVLDMTEEMDLDPELALVESTVIVLDR